MKYAAALFFLTLSFSAMAETVISGDEAKTLFQNLKGYEYSYGAKTAGLELRYTVRHDNEMSCERAVTIYTNESSVEYTCTIK